MTSDSTSTTNVPQVCDKFRAVGVPKVPDAKGSSAQVCYCNLSTVFFLSSLRTSSNTQILTSSFPQQIDSNEIQQFIYLKTGCLVVFLSNCVCLLFLFPWL